MAFAEFSNRINPSFNLSFAFLSSTHWISNTLPRIHSTKIRRFPCRRSCGFSYVMTWGRAIRDQTHREMSAVSVCLSQGAEMPRCLPYIVHIRRQLFVLCHFYGDLHGDIIFVCVLFLLLLFNFLSFVCFFASFILIHLPVCIRVHDNMAFVSACMELSCHIVVDHRRRAAFVVHTFSLR